jgi:hypothetical protein
MIDKLPEDIWVTILPFLHDFKEGGNYCKGNCTYLSKGIHAIVIKFLLKNHVFILPREHAQLFRACNISVFHYKGQDHWTDPLPDHIQEIRDLDFEWKHKWPSKLTSLAWFTPKQEPVEWPRNLRKLSLLLDTHMPTLELPPTLEKLSLGTYHLVVPFDYLVVPLGVEFLEIESDINVPLVNYTLPKGLKTLKLGWKYNHPIDGVVWPESLEELDLGMDFNQPLIADDVLPQSLRVLIFSWRFNQEVRHLRWPPNLKKLEFNSDFNRSMDGVKLPDTLECLEFGDEFAQPITGLRLPSGLHTLRFSYEFNHSLRKVRMPPNLHTLYLSWRYSRSLHKVSLRNVKRLHLGEHFRPKNPAVRWPQNLIELAIDCNDVRMFEHLPKGLRILSLSGFNLPIARGMFPDCIISLELGDQFNRSLGEALPKSLTRLKLGSWFNQPLDNVVWPRRLEFIDFSTRFNHSLKPVPSTVERIVIYSGYPHPIEFQGTVHRVEYPFKSAQYY